MAYFLFKSWTPPIFSDDAVAELTSITVNEDRQLLLIRGRDRRNPILLFLHGEPGIPAMYLAHAFQRDWEKHFVVVHWDQWASGKSFGKGLDPSLIRTSQLISDAEAIVEYLRECFPGQPIFLLGHSHGRHLGAILASRHPEWFSAFIGVGQVADEGSAREIQDAYLSPLLSEYGYGPDAELTQALRAELLFRTGSELHGETSFVPLLITGLLAPEYSFFDAMTVAQGSSFSSAHMKKAMIDGPLMSAVQSFDLPVYIIMGAHDMVTLVGLARRYFDSIEAPDKAFHVVENAAHFPFFEQPARVLEILERVAR
ncbi:MAG: alpha/beta hydrolase [Xanthomonadales bacterium]|nr:alpha/beta hydrolase [Xanthomonadales bacterium]